MSLGLRVKGSWVGVWGCNLSNHEGLDSSESRCLAMSHVEDVPCMLVCLSLSLWVSSFSRSLSLSLPLVLHFLLSLSLWVDCSVRWKACNLISDIYIHTSVYTHVGTRLDLGRCLQGPK